VPRVLLADDEESLRIVLSRLLRNLGYDVVTVANGAEALAAYLEAPKSWGLVMLDIVMPVMTGVGAYHAIRAYSAQTNVLLCSGYHTESIGGALATDPRLRFLGKPFDTQELQRVLGGFGVMPSPAAMLQRPVATAEICATA